MAPRVIDDQLRALRAPQRENYPERFAAACLAAREADGASRTLRAALASADSHLPCAELHKETTT